VAEGSCRFRAAGASEAAEVIEVVELFDAMRIGENVDIADPGRAGVFLAAIAAFF
jgi:hypothetical protein